MIFSVSGILQSSIAEMEFDGHEDDVDTRNLEHDSKVEEAIMEYGFDRDEPGATTLWFGKHKGDRFDSLDEGYRWSIIRLYEENPTVPYVSRYLLASPPEIIS